jgi:hypothetical protein
VRFGLCVGAALLAGSLSEGGQGRLLHAERSFFGVHRIARVRGEAGSADLNLLFHGTTVHGKQRVDARVGAPADPDVPLAYYHREGPAGRLLAAYPAERFRRIGIVGLGAGALLAHAAPGTSVTCFEIDPAVRRIAEDPRFFTHLAAARARGVGVDVVLGDARRSLLDVEGGAFDLLVLDAFGSDAVPVHLLTVEAGHVYRRVVEPDGLIVFHVSSRHLDLLPVVAGLAESLGRPCAAWRDRPRGIPAGLSAERSGSDWAVIAPARAALAPLAPDRAGSPWRWPTAPAGFRPFTDDFSSLFSVLSWPAVLGLAD